MPKSTPSIDRSELGSKSDDQLRQPTQIQKEMIGCWVELADDLSIPRSLAQLYGLLYSSREALNAQDCAELLRMSRSSAGQGLRTLKEYGAIRSTFEFGNRSEYFTIETDLGVLLRNVLEGRLLPAFSRFFEQHQSLAQEHSQELTPFMQERLEKLQRWKHKASSLREWLE